MNSRNTVEDVQHEGAAVHIVREYVSYASFRDASPTWRSNVCASDLDHVLMEGMAILIVFASFTDAVGDTRHCYVLMIDLWECHQLTIP